MFDGKYFLNQIQGCTFEKDFDIVVNLFLVLNNARPAYLHVQYDGDYEKQDSILNEIKIKFPNITITRIGFMNFIHIHPLPQLKDDESYNEHLGKTLGFFFPGDIDHKENVYSSIHYLANGSHFYAEVCKTLINDVNKIEKREQEWNSILSNINITVTTKIDKWLSDEYLLSIVTKKDVCSVLKNSNEFLAYFKISDYQLPKFASLLQTNLEDNFFKYHDYILMIILCKDHGLFEIDLIENIETFESLLDNFIVEYILENDANCSYEIIVNFINVILNKYPEWLEKVNYGNTIVLLKQKKEDAIEIIHKFDIFRDNTSKIIEIAN